MVNLLKKIAMKSDHKNYKHATIVLRGGAVVAFGANLGKRHSEVVALSKIWPNKRKGCRIVNIRIRRDGSFGMSKPCKNCSKFLKENGVISVTYTVPNTLPTLKAYVGDGYNFTEKI